MIRKIVLWTVYALIVGVLVFGAANRTSAKVDQGLLFVGLNDAFGERGRGNNGASSKDDFGEFEPDDHEEVIGTEDLLEMSGTITDISGDFLEIEAGSAGILILEGRSWRFLQESGYVPLIGNEVVVQGFIEDGEFEASSLYDLTGGQIFPIRDEYGRPLWSGRGN